MSLKNCPLCGAEAVWCGEEASDIHDCHFIVCVGCGTQFDTVTKEDADTLEDLKTLALAKFNKRIV